MHSLDNKGSLKVSNLKSPFTLYFCPATLIFTFRSMYRVVFDYSLYLVALLVMQRGCTFLSLSTINGGRGFNALLSHKKKKNDLKFWKM